MKKEFEMKYFVFVVIFSFILLGCASKSHFIMKGENEIKLSSECASYHVNKIRTKRYLKKRKIIPPNPYSKGFSYKVIFKGNENNFIGEINCYGAFQDPQYLIFQRDSVITIFHNVFNIEDIYKEYSLFTKSNYIEGATDREIWDYIIKFINMELQNKYHKIIW